MGMDWLLEVFCRKRQEFVAAQPDFRVGDAAQGAVGGGGGFESSSRAQKTKAARSPQMTATIPKAVHSLIQAPRKIEHGAAHLPGSEQEPRYRFHAVIVSCSTVAIETHTK